MAIPFFVLTGTAMSRGGYCDNYEIWTPGLTSYFANDISVLISADTYREHLLAFDCEVAATLDTPWMHVHSGGARLIPEFLTIPGLKGIQIVNDRPAGPALKELVTILKELQKHHCLSNSTNPHNASLKTHIPQNFI